MERKMYFLGLSGNCKLSVEENRLFYYDDRGKNEKVLLECNKSDKSMKICTKKENDDEYVGIDENEVEKGAIKMLKEDGTRWEGDWYNEKPFGFGSLYDGEGNRIYSGFMFDGKKIGFGEEYFADNHQVDYCGNFVNDKRHGWGTTYDRNNIKLYEGDWRCGKNDFEDERIEIEENRRIDDLRVHECIKELTIGENCFTNWFGDYVIENYPNLQSLVVKKDSWKNLNSLSIWNCRNLKMIEIEDGDNRFENGKWENGGAFRNVKSLIIQSIRLFFKLFIYIFQNYNQSKQDMDHSPQQQVYLYQVILSNSTFI